MVEQGSDLKQLRDKLQKNEARLARSQQIIDTIELDGFSQAEPLRLDIEDDAKFLENYDRIGRIKERLIDYTVPEAYQQIVDLNLQVKRLSIAQPMAVKSGPAIVKRGQWSPEQIQVFESARERLNQLDPEIKQRMDQFNQENNVGWQLQYRLGNNRDRNSDLRWGVLETRMKNQGRRKEVFDVNDSIGIFQEANDDELRLLSQFVAEISEQFDLRTGKVYYSQYDYFDMSQDLGGADPQKVRPTYFLKPKFEDFTQTNQSESQKGQVEKTEAEQQREQLLAKFKQDTRETYLSDQEQHVIDILTDSEAVNLEKAVPATKIEEELWPADQDLESRRERLYRLMSRVRKTIRDTKWDVKNGQPRRNEGQYYLAYQGDDIKSEQEKSSEAILNFYEDSLHGVVDGRVFGLNESQLIVLRTLANHLGEDLKTSQLSLEAFGDPDPVKMNIRKHLSNLKEKLNIPGNPDYLITSGPKSAQSWVKLQGVKLAKEESEEPTVTTQDSEPPKEAATQNLRAELDLANKEVTLYANGFEKTVRIEDEIEWDVFKFLATHPETVLRADTPELINISERFGISNVAYQPSRVQFAIRNLAAAINVEGFEPIIKEEIVQGVPQFELAITPDAQIGVNDVRFARGVAVKTDGTWEAAGLRKLVESQGEPISIDELTKFVFGDEASGHARIIGIIRKLNLHLARDLGETEHYCQVTWNMNDVWLIDKRAEERAIFGNLAQPSNQSEIPSETNAPLASPDTNDGSNAQSTLVISEGGNIREKTVIAYNPPERFVRTAEENNILTVLLDQFSSHSELYYDDIQRQLRSADRIKKQPDGSNRYYIYTAKELKEKVQSAYTKLVQGQLLPRLRELYTEEDERLLRQINDLVDSKHEGDSEQFIKALNDKIDRAVRSFYSTFKPEGGDSPWIKI